MELKHSGLVLVHANDQKAELSQLGWDTEATGRESINVLKEPVTVQDKNGTAFVIQKPPVSTGPGRLLYALSGGLDWEIAVGPDGLSMDFRRINTSPDNLNGLRLVFPFEPAVSVMTAISSRWTPEGRFLLPAIFSLPDLGQMRVDCNSAQPVTGRVDGSRRDHWITATLDLPDHEDSFTLTFTPVRLPCPTGFSDKDRWQKARRGWFNLIQLSCGASGGSQAVRGVWANNTLSDPVSAVLFMLADATLLVPELAPGVSLPPILRRTIDFWLDEKTNADGMVAYTAAGTAGSEQDEKADQPVNPTNCQNVMDANPSVLIAAWAYIRTSGDMKWLNRRISDLEHLASFMERHDRDQDGLIESRQSGNSGSRPPRNPDCAWDCYVSGHKNAYVNALAYRSFRCLAALEHLLERFDRARHYQHLADRLKEAFLLNFYNPVTGWLGFWRSRDGQLHDLWSDMPTSIALVCGVLEPDAGKPMLERFWQALKQSGFNRFDLGIPANLRPVPETEMEHYTPFEQFLNGGCCVSNTAWLIDALNLCGRRQEAEMILDAMLQRQADGVFANGGAFQNGFVDRMGYGAEVFDWQGRPAGYEGHLVYCWSFLHALLMSNPDMRKRVDPVPDPV